MAQALQRPFVFKLKWVVGQQAGRRASSHAKYIATREGVARVDEERPDALVHARYLDERPGSTGLFGPEAGAPPRLADVQHEVAARPWHWQSVISLKAADAQTLGLREPSDWRDLARRVMGQYAQAAGMAADDLRWVGAVHRKEGQPHVHLLAWVREGAPDRAPALTRPQLRDVRRVIAREMYGPLRAQLAAERTASRDDLVRASRLNLDQARRLHMEAEAAAPGAEKPAPAFPRGDLEELARRIDVLAPQMPGKGQVALAYMPEPVKAEARSIADWVLERPALAEALGGLERATRDLTALYSGRQQAGDAAWGKAREDVRDRVAQGVLKAAAQHQRAEARTKREKVREVRQSAGQVLRAAHNALERERRRSEAKAELARMSAAEAAEERGRHERRREMGLER